MTNITLMLDELHGTTTLGALIDGLERLQQSGETQWVYFDFASCVPADCDSSRGDYSHLALGWYYDRFRYESQPSNKLSDVINRLKIADGATYDGWKGGEFGMDRSTPIWCDNRGEWTGTAIVGLAYSEGMSFIRILTKHVPD